MMLNIFFCVCVCSETNMAAARTNIPARLEIEKKKNQTKQNRKKKSNNENNDKNKTLGT